MASEAVGIGMIGCGTVGLGVAALLHEHASTYAQRVGRPIELRRVLVRDASTGRANVPKSILTDDADAFFATDGMDIVIEVAGGCGVIEDHVKRALSAGKHIVTANKALLAASGPDLFALAHANEASVAFEASCGGGIPIVTSLQFGLMANRIDDLYGILNGTCNYILSEMTQKGKSYAEALSEAQDEGFAEADPTMDVSGKDAAQKLAVLASLAFGVRLEEAQVWHEGIDNLDLSDLNFGKELGYDIKLLAIAERRESGLSLRVHPSFVPVNEMLAQVHGSFNALSVYGDALGHTLSYGRGAGQLPTASAVVSDVLNVASGWYPKAFLEMGLWSDQHSPTQLIHPDELVSRFYIRVNAMDEPAVMAKVATILGDAGISLSDIIQHEVAAGNFVPLAITTHDARQGDLFPALKQIEQLDVIEGVPVCIRIVNMPEG